MAPKPQEHQMTSASRLPPEITASSVVISGFSGTYPQSLNAKDFSDILYNGVNPIPQCKPRWKFVHPEVPLATGFIPEIDRYDAQFFKVHSRQASVQDTMSKKVLEHSYQAIFDAGVSAEQLNGKSVGVYIGAASSEHEKAVFCDITSTTGFGMPGGSKTMYANRISYWLNVKGPSMAIEAGCSGAIVALEQAVKDIESGECEAAIVGGVNICMHPHSGIHFGRQIKLNNDGKQKCFSEDCDGLTRSEGINVLFVQRADQASRIYAHVLKVKSEFIPFPGKVGFGHKRNPTEVAKFIERFYEQANVSPKAVEYVEAFGSAERESEKNELEALEKVYCKNRSDPLLVGSVMSNVGYTESATGITAISKVLLGYETGLLAANLHCTNPRQDVAALRDGRMRIVTQHQPFNRSYVAINNLSYNGSNTHVLLHGHYKPKDLNRYKSTIPHLVTISGRLEAAVDNIINDLKSHPVDPEQLALLHNINEYNQYGHMSRGYAILDTNEKGETVCLAQKADHFDSAKRPLWFVYSGMGSQWAGMGKDLMKIPVFAAAIEKCRKVLEPKGIDIVHIITANDKTIFDNILNSFVGIAAVQIGLTDVLTSIGIVPDKIIGHSVGELGCGYADGCFTAEEMILAAYSRGLVSVQTPFIRGSMAAVGIGYQQVVNLCPPDIEVACHNGPESATISGPAESMKEFVSELTAKGVFAKEVPCSNIAFHSRYIAEAGPKLLEFLTEVIKNPKKRSDRWLSSSIPKARWGEEQAQYCSPWYHTNNLLSPVLFEETSRMVPSNAVLIEIAPHGLLQAILKRSLSPDCHHIPLTKRGLANNATFVLEAIAKLYMEGYDPKIKALYPKVEFPVSTGTPMLSHLVKWNHSESWPVPLYGVAEKKSSRSCDHIISFHDEESAYLRGSVVRGKIQYPFAAALVAVWDTVAMSLGAKKKQLSVEFRDVHLHSQPVLLEGKHLPLKVTLHWGTGLFEVMNGVSKVANGLVKTEFDEDVSIEESQNQDEYLALDSKDVYDLLRERSYSYTGDFCSIHRTNSSFTKAQLIWNDNWVTFIDGLLQLNTLHHNHSCVAQPSHINKIVIDVKNHIDGKIDISDDKIVLNADLNSIQGVTKSGGVQISKIQFYDFPPLTNDTLLLKSLKFIPYFQTDCNNLIEIFKTYLQMVAENSMKDVIKVIEVTISDTDAGLDIETMLKDIPNVTAEYDQIDRDGLLKKQDTLDVDVILVTNLSLDKKTLEGLKRTLKPGTFVINGEQIGERNNLPSDWYRVASSGNVGRSLLELARWKPTKKQTFSSSVIVRTEDDFDKLGMQREQLSPNGKLFVLTPHPPVEGLKDLIKIWRKDSSRNQIFLASVSGQENLERLPWSSFDFDLVYNVLHNGIWGGEYFVQSQEHVAVERGMTLLNSKIGDLDSLHWVETPEPTGDGILVNVRYAGINDFDVKRATGVIPFTEDDVENHRYGMDYSGTTESGERVMGIVRIGAASHRVRAVKQLLWPVPSHWTLEDAATVPLAYAQAFYCFGIRASLYPGMRVLVHGGAGALGQAAISIALANRCEVFTTVGSKHKKNVLKKLFPQLKDDHIGSSRDDTFGDMVLSCTEGQGCDIILSCVKGGLKNTTLRCAAFCGITFDTVQAYSEDTYRFGMYNMTQQRSYVVVDFDSVFDYPEDMEALQEMMSSGIARGYVRPLSRCAVGAHAPAAAFRLRAAGRHCGRTLLRLRDHDIPAAPRITCPPEAIHLIFCEPAGVGLQLAGRLVKRGARKLRLVCTSALPNNLHFKVVAWIKQGVDVEVSAENLDATSIETVVAEALCKAPIEGVYMDVSGTSDDRIILHSLDLATRKLCTSLKRFVLLASNTKLGQNICQTRAKDGLPATLMHIPTLKEGLVSWPSLLDAVEGALHCPQAVLKVQAVRGGAPSLFQQITSVADVSIENNNLEDAMELHQLGFDSSKAQVISAYLKNTHNISLTDEEIPHLTVRDINTLEERLTEPEFKNGSGLHAFLTSVESSELAACEPIVFMPTLVKKTKMREEEIDVTLPYIMMVPGVEGLPERLGELCARLKAPALVLQPGAVCDHLGATLRDTAQLYAQALRKKVQIKDNFYLLGYEAGVKLALEVAHIFENDGFTGTVFCVGGVPEELDAIVESKLKEYSTEEALQNAFIRHMAEILLKGASTELESVLQPGTPWETKLDSCVNVLTGRVGFTKQYIRLLLDTTYKRLKQLREEKVQTRGLKSRLVVIRAAECAAVSEHVLQQYSAQPVAAYALPAPLAHAAADPRVSAILNRHLSPQLLEEFENSNICDTYLVNAEQFIPKSANIDELI